MEAHLEQMHERLKADRVWHDERQAQIDAARTERQRRVSALNG
jgi:hypothetical protein